jgi:hypothetical protein
VNNVVYTSTLKLKGNKMKQKYYKAVSLKRLSHWDQKTKWRVGSIVRSDFADIENSQLCGHGIHVSPTLLDAVSYQTAPSRYYEVEPIEIIAEGNTKSRCTAVNVIREIGKEEQDKLAGFKLYEANHPINPLLLRKLKVTPIDIENLKKWDSVWDSVGVSVWAYIGGLFPNITKWKYAESLGADPWRPLLDLWYRGFVPSFDGTTWRLHQGKDAKIVYEWRKQ